MSAIHQLTSNNEKNITLIHFLVLFRYINRGFVSKGEVKILFVLCEGLTLSCHKPSIYLAFLLIHKSVIKQKQYLLVT